MKQTINVSVVLPVYNAQASLPQCMDSILGQSLREIELICVDDGSTDASIEILRRYAQRDSRVRVLSQENQYAGVARNRGMQAARGTYIAFLDADDFYLPGALDALYKAAERGRADLVKGSFCCLDTESGRRYTTLYSTNSSISRRQRRRPLSLRQAPARLLHVADVPWNGMYRRGFLEKHGVAFNTLRCVNDHSFYIHCLMEAERILIVDQVVACYRVAQAGSLVGQKAEHFENQIRSYGIVRDLCRNIEPDLSRQILRQELNGVLGWYQRIAAAARPEQLAGQLAEFLRGYDEEDVGGAYLRAFSFRGLYYGIRYGIPPPGRRPPLPVRMLRCWQEHGWRYTLARMSHKQIGVGYEFHSGD